MSRLFAIGLNHRTAPIALRESAAFAQDAVPAALDNVRTTLGLSEYVLLSTCNRTELYAVADEKALTRDNVIRFLTDAEPDSDVSELRSQFYELHDREAADHLLKVCASLNSMVVGEVEILGQVKQAYRMATDAGVTGKTTNAVFQHAFRTAKRVHTETNITQGRVSVSSIAVEFARHVFSDLNEKTVMIIGAGETAELTLRCLVEQGVHDVIVLNRSLDKAQRLVDQHGGKAGQLDFLAEFLPKADIVISSSGAPHCLIEKPLLNTTMKARQHRPMLLVDIAVPRDIASDISELTDVYLYHIDDLQRVAERNLEKRQAAVDEASEIVKHGLEGLSDLFDRPDLDLLLRDFDIHARRIAGDALAKSLKKERMTALPEPCRKEVEALVYSVTKRLLAQPRTAIKHASKNGQWDLYAGMVRDLFGVHPTDAQETGDDRSEGT
ncbi:MAG: glutamyl-tRNA reductase [Kiritimatiellia bacterium]